VLTMIDTEGINGDDQRTSGSRHVIVALASRPSDPVVLMRELVRCGPARVDLRDRTGVDT
jgi:hypothetical protein